MTPMRAMQNVVFAVLLFAGACTAPHNTSTCMASEECDLFPGGQCLPSPLDVNLCAYPSADCETELAWGELSGALSGTCTPLQYALTLSVGGSGRGGISSSPEGIMCASGGTGTCTTKFPPGTIVELSAAATGGVFLGWGDACNGKATCRVTMDRDQAVGALFGAPGEALWALQIGSAGNDYATATVVDGDDKLLVTGRFTGMVNVGGKTLSAGTGTGSFIAKLDSSTGQAIWANSYGDSNGSAEGFALAVDESNNVYATGKFNGTIDFGAGPVSANGTAAYVLKLSPSGNYAWVRHMGKAGTVTVASGIAARGGAVAVGGSFLGETTIDSTTLTSHLNGTNSDYETFALSLATANGSTNWVKSFGNDSYDAADDVTIDAAGNPMFVGHIAGNVDFGGGLQQGKNDNDVYLLKLAKSDGSYLAAVLLGSSGRDVPTGITSDAANNIYITGEYGGIADMGCANSLPALDAVQPSIFLAKYTQAGACVWAKGFAGASTGSTINRAAGGVAANGVGEIAISGGFCGSVSFGGAPLMSAGGCPRHDVYAARFATDGTLLNAVRAGGTGYEAGIAVAQSADGRFFVAGSFQTFAEFGSTAFTAVGGDDAFILALAPF